MSGKEGRGDPMEKDMKFTTAEEWVEEKDYKAVIMQGMVVMKSVHFKDLDNAFRYVEKKEKEGYHAQIYSVFTKQQIY